MKMKIDNESMFGWRNQLINSDFGLQNWKWIATKGDSSTFQINEWKQKHDSTICVGVECLMRCTLVITWPSFPFHSFITMSMWMSFSMYKKCKQIFSLLEGENCNNNNNKKSRQIWTAKETVMSWMNKKRQAKVLSITLWQWRTSGNSNTNNIHQRRKPTNVHVSPSTCLHCFFPFYSWFTIWIRTGETEIDQNTYAERKWKICRCCFSFTSILNICKWFQILKINFKNLFWFFDPLNFEYVDIFSWKRQTNLFISFHMQNFGYPKYCFGENRVHMWAIWLMKNKKINENKCKILIFWK